MKLRHQFTDRADLIGYLKETFPEAATRSPQVSEIRGGRSQAEQRLAKVDPARYSTTRNSLDGAVTRLSPYLRHGVISLGYVRQVARQRGRAADKLVNELAWRDYFQRVYERIGDGIWQNREEYKTGWQPTDYSPELPAEIPAGRTGLVCMDSFATELAETGYLHNHARMWLASYIVHHRRVQWQAGAGWFLEHLLDGDPASNNLSWQWVASTFAAKPYFFNRGNLEQFTEGRYCRVCLLANNHKCPFDKSIPQLEAALFPNRPPDAAQDTPNFKPNSRPRAGEPVRRRDRH